jgi:uncharacterized protein (TIGR02679 family)
MTCRLCDSSCADGTLTGLVTADLGWLWAQLADAADRRGDPYLLQGTATVQIPEGVAERSAATGLLRQRQLKPGARRINLAELAHKIAPLAPGVVAAHATGRRLAVRAEAKAARTASETSLRAHLGGILLGAATDTGWATLRRSGWVARLASSDDWSLLERAIAVITALPGADQPAIDRRRLAVDATGDPHALDAGRPVAGLTLALLAASGRPAVGDSLKEQWASVGVAYDDITGGLTTLGIAPTGWGVPPGLPVTLPPRVLADCVWPAGDGRDVYVTENPSIIGAATTVADARVICTSGTPSRAEVAALARLAEAGWQLHVRADFDDSGLGHVRSILAAAPRARPWRMGSADYLWGLETGDSAEALRVDRLGTAPWDPALVVAMAAKGVAVYEETFLDQLMADVAPE